jgi:TctA family transporter
MESETERRKGLALTGEILAWIWFVLAGIGGFLLLLQRGPWPLTNGWYALFSGLSACPLVALALRKTTGIRIRGWWRLAGAAFFLVAGRIALLVGT